MNRVHLFLSVVVAVVIAWTVPLSDVLDFDLDARFVWQILDGYNPYDLGVVPRPPSAWLLQLPLAWIDTGLLSRIAGAASSVSVSWLSLRILKLRSMWLPVFTGAVSLTFLARGVVSVGNMASVVAILTVCAWARRSGIAVGVASALRIYPMIFVFAVRKRSALWTVAALTIVGLVIVPDFGLSGFVENNATILPHPGNGSLHRMVGLWASVVVGVLIAWRITRVGFDHGMALGACAAVLVPSVSWPSYSLILVPAVAWAVSHGRWWALAAVPLWFTEGVRILGTDFGTATFVAAWIVLSAVWAVPSQARDGEWAEGKESRGASYPHDLGWLSKR